MSTYTVGIVPIGHAYLQLDMHVLWMFVSVCANRLNWQFFYFDSNVEPLWWASFYLFMNRRKLICMCTPMSLGQWIWIDHDEPFCARLVCRPILHSKNVIGHFRQSMATITPLGGYFRHFHLLNIIRICKNTVAKSINFPVELFAQMLHEYNESIHLNFAKWHWSEAAILLRVATIPDLTLG